MAVEVSEVLSLMRVALGRRNVNDPDSDDNTMLSYFNDAYQYTMSDDVALFENFGTLNFTIDETTTDGVYTFNNVGASRDFVTISLEGIISLTDPINNSVSWSNLRIYQDPGTFFGYWGINNEETLIRGFPTEMLYYGDEFTFRTLPNDTYTIHIYGYQKNDAKIPAENIDFDHWKRYLVYLAALNYAQDYRYEANEKAMIKQGYQRERKLLLTRTHNQKKYSRCVPKF